MGAATKKRPQELPSDDPSLVQAASEALDVQERFAELMVLRVEQVEPMEWNIIAVRNGRPMTYIMRGTGPSTWRLLAAFAGWPE